MRRAPLLFLAVLPACGVIHSDTVAQASREETRFRLIVSVTDSVSGRPISEAALRLTNQDGSPHETDSDAKGQATFDGIAPGTWRVRATASGYVDLLDPNGQGRSVTIAAGNASATVQLTRSATITGTVRDSKGEPFEGVKVVAVARRGAGQTRRLTTIGEPARTDDRGSYRLFGVPPGWYAVAVFSSDGRAGTAFPPVYSAFFELAPGETLGNINLVTASSEGAAVSGTISGISDESHPPIAGVALVPRSGVPAIVKGAFSEAGGAFVIYNVPAGEYQLLAWSPPETREKDGPPAPSFARAASRSLTVSAGDQQSALTLQPLVTVTGRFSKDAACTGEGRLLIDSLDGWSELWPPSITMEADRFKVEGVPAGRYRIGLHAGDACRLAAVLVGGREVSRDAVSIDAQTQLTLVLTSASGGVSGTVAPNASGPALGIVLLAPPDGEGAIQTAPIDASGRYAFERVVAGNYVIVARRKLESLNYLDAVESPKLGAKIISVQAGQNLKCDLSQK